MTTHVLKCLSAYYVLIEQGVKTFEIRFNDRDFNEGDYLMLHEIDEKKRLTGACMYVKVLYILFEFEGFQEGFVCMSICPTDKPPITINQNG